MMPVVYFDQQNHAFAWSKMIKNAIKLFKTYFYHHAYERLTHKYEEKSFFLILRRDSNPPRQSQFCYQTSALPPSHHGWVEIQSNCRYFFSIFDHANECASMRSLVEIHNRCERLVSCVLKITQFILKTSKTKLTHQY